MTTGEAMMRRTKFLVGATTFLVVVLGVAALVMWFRPGQRSLEKRLIGAWAGTGSFSGDWSIGVQPKPEQGIPGGNASGRMTTSATVEAEFKSDGTYIWREHLEGSGIHMDISLPKDADSLAHWEVVSAKGDKLTVRIHFGDVACDFQGENAFTMNLPESAKVGDGAFVFHRSGVEIK
jgi:hypothetical protein